MRLPQLTLVHPPCDCVFQQDLWHFSNFTFSRITSRNTFSAEDESHFGKFPQLPLIAVATLAPPYKYHTYVSDLTLNRCWCSYIRGGRSVWIIFYLHMTNLNFVSHLTLCFVLEPEMILVTSDLSCRQNVTFPIKSPFNIFNFLQMTSLRSRNWSQNRISWPSAIGWFKFSVGFQVIEQKRDLKQQK